MYIIIAPVERLSTALLSVNVSPPGRKATFGIALHGILTELPTLHPSDFPDLNPETRDGPQ